MDCDVAIGCDEEDPVFGAVGEKQDVVLEIVGDMVMAFVYSWGHV